MVAAAAVVSATTGTFVAEALNSDSVACELKLARAEEGPPMLRVARAAMKETYNAQIHLELARLSKDPEQRRAHAYQAIMLVNDAIMTAYPLEKNGPKLWPYPSDRALEQPGYYGLVFKKIEQLDYGHLVSSLKRVDEQSAEELSDLYGCAAAADNAALLKFLAVLLTALSVFLIAARENKDG